MGFRTINEIGIFVVLLFFFTVVTLFSEEGSRGLEGYAGPGWSVLFGPGDVPSILKGMYLTKKTVADSIGGN